jgi:chromosome segregation ATPase
MSQLDEIERLQRSLILSEERIGHVSSSLFGVERDMDFLMIHALGLTKNIRYLKKHKVITLASEYKSIKEELDLVNRRLEILKGDRENFRTVYAHIEVDMIRLKEELDVLINDPGATVIEADFRRSRG